MSEDLTRNLPDSFEERVLAELAAMRQEFRQEISQVKQELAGVKQELVAQREMIQQLHARVVSVETRLTALEEKVDERLRETRPVWEAVQQRLTGIEKELFKLSRQLRTAVSDMFDLHSRVQTLEGERSV